VSQQSDSPTGKECPLITNAPVPSLPDKLARLSKLSVAERSRVMSEALLVCSQDEAAYIAPILIQLALRPETLHTAVPSRPLTARVNATPSKPDGKPDIEALRTRYGLSKPGLGANQPVSQSTREQAASVAPSDPSATQPHTHAAPRGFLSKLRHWLQNSRVQDTDAALIELARGWLGVPPLARDAALAAGSNRWHTIATRVEDTRPTVLRGLALLAAEAADARLISWPLAAARAPDPSTVDAARWSLFTLALLATPLSPLERESWLAAAQRDETWRRLLTRGLARGLAGDARAVQTGILAALQDPSACEAAAEAALLIMPQAMQQSLASQPEHAQRALAAAIKSLRAPFVRVRALELLASARGAIASACVLRLARTQGPLDHQFILQRSALAIRPARQVALHRVIVRGARRTTRAGATIDLTATALANAGEVAALPVEAVRALPRWSASIHADAPTRERALEPLLSHVDATTRFAAALHGPTRLARDFVFDTDPRIARHALVRLTAAARDGAPFDALPASRSPHAHVAALASAHAARHAAAFEPTVGGRLATLRWYTTDRDACTKTLRWMLTQSDAPAAHRAINALRRAALVDVMLDALRDRATSSATDEASLRAAASACAALGDSREPIAASTVRALLTHTDARVRANAVESLARLARRGVRSLPSEVFELKTDPHHRIRANALRETLLVSVEPRMQLAAADDLASMLSDDRPLHRLAGLWLASRTLVGPTRSILRARWTEMSSRIGALATSDTDPRVRTRAAACATATAALTRASWISSAGDLGATSPPTFDLASVLGEPMPSDSTPDTVEPLTPAQNERSNP